MKKKNVAKARKSAIPGVVGAGVAALAAGVAGAYFLQSAKNRKKLKGWMLKMKGEALEQVEKLKEVNEDAYHKAVDAASRRYLGLKHVDQEKLSKITKELKKHWKNINRHITKVSR